MRRYHIKISAGGVLLLAALYFFMDARDFIALLLAAAAHECGHLAALRAAGCRIRGFSADAGGAVIERRGGAGPSFGSSGMGRSPAITARMSSGSKPGPRVDARRRVYLSCPGARNEITPPRPCFT